MNSVGPFVVRHALVIAAVAGLVWTCPVNAQDAEAARRLALAERYVDLSMGTGLGKLLEDAVEQELEAVDGLSQTERDWMQANVPIILRRHVDAMVDDMAPWDPLESTCRHASLSIL